jgi:hypothetical protein
MGCLECKNLEEAFESRLSQYIDARTAAYYRVTTELAAQKNVDMERAKSVLPSFSRRIVRASPVSSSSAGHRSVGKAACHAL